MKTNKKNLGVTLLFVILSLGCKSSVEKKLPILYKLPESLKEVSGIAITQNLTWVIEDSGNKNHIYGLASNGKIKSEIEISNSKNIDWEDLTTDSKGNLYIGDFGNNKNTRKDLSIYAISKEELNQKSIIIAEPTSFSYPEQTEFPPAKSNLFYDCEAFFEWHGNFYLFTKNRSKNADGTVLIYKIPNKKGIQKATLLGSFISCNEGKNCAITSAAINSDGSKVVLLTHDSVFLFENFKNDDFTSGKLKKLELNHVSQKESICFKDDLTLLIADEKKSKKDGNVYEIKLENLKTKS